jgi:hypothetical protein
MSANISDIVNAKIIELLLEVCRKTVIECSQHYGFSSEEALNKMNLLTDFSMLCQVQSEEVQESVSDVSSVKTQILEKKVACPMPYNGTCDESKCQALKLNHGLYTQCETKKQKEKELCKACEKNNVLGTMKERMAVGIMEFKDNKGKSPTPYMKVLNKLKITKEEAEKEADNKKVTINSIHWTEEEVKEVKKKVTKKVVKKEVVNEVAKEDVKEVVNEVVNEVAKEDVKENVNEVVKEDVKEVVKEDVKAEKKKTEKKKKEKKEGEEESATSSKKGRPKKEKEEKPKGEKGRPKKEKKETEIASPMDDLFANLVAKEEEPPQVDVVNKIEFQGITYLKSKTTGVIYNMEQDQVGKWNENTSTIDFEEGEEEEEEYDE